MAEICRDMLQCVELWRTVAAICMDMLQCVELWRTVAAICRDMLQCVEFLIISNIPLMKALSSSRLRSSVCLLLSSDCINLRSDAATISFILLAKAPAVCSLLV